MTSESSANTCFAYWPPHYQTAVSPLLSSADSRLVTEKEMMMVARWIGNSWKQVGITALDMNTIVLQQIEEDNRQHTDRVFAMLRRWSMRERNEATPTHLYDLLTQEENGVDPIKINFLLESSWGRCEHWVIQVAVFKCKHATTSLEGAMTAIQLQWMFTYLL